MKKLLHLLSITICCLILIQHSTAQLSGSYTIGTTEADYITITEAITALTTSGISGDVSFLIEDGTYQESITIGSYSGNETNRVTLKSASEDATLVKIQYASTGWNDKQTILLENAKNFNFEQLTIQFEGFMGNGKDETKRNSYNRSRH